MQNEGASGIFVAVVAVILGSIVLSGAGLLVLRDDDPSILGGTPSATATESALAAATQVATATGPRTATPTPTATPTAAATTPAATTSSPTSMGTSAPVRSASRTPSPTPDAGVRYTVRPGDALELIAGQYGVSSAAIVEENDLVPPYILEVGQVLVIPTEQ